MLAGEDGKGEEDFLQLIGEMIVSWNRCEGRVRDLIIWLSGGRSPATLALTAHLNAISLIQTLEALANGQEVEIGGHIDHFRECVDRLREYRNYYVHGISDVGPGWPISPQTGAWIYQVSGRRRVTIRSEIIDYTALHDLCIQLRLVADYGKRIHHMVDPSSGPMGFRARSFAPLIKPPLPPKLRKAEPILLGERPTGQVKSDDHGKP